MIAAIAALLLLLTAITVVDNTSIGFSGTKGGAVARVFGTVDLRSATLGAQTELGAATFLAALPGYAALRTSERVFR
jgi:hypothetical protein